MSPQKSKRAVQAQEEKATRLRREDAADLDLVEESEFEAEEDAAGPAVPVDEPRLQHFSVAAESAGTRLDAFLVGELGGVSRSRIQTLIEQGGVSVDGKSERASLKLRGGETIEVRGRATLAPLKAFPEKILLDVIYEDEDLAVINKPAGMMVHAGAGATEDERNRGTLVNALLYRFEALSSSANGMRPGIVHRLDKETSGLILVAKNDETHLKLAKMFADRQVKKTYIALAHGELPAAGGTINSPIGRDVVRRTRMTTKVKGEAARSAITHFRLSQIIRNQWGVFSLARVRIETGRTHQIRVHLSSIGHPIAGDTLYGAPSELFPRVESRQGGQPKRSATAVPLTLGRNFLHAAQLAFDHPRTGKRMELEAPLAPELEAFLTRLRENQ